MYLYGNAARGQDDLLVGEGAVSYVIASWGGIRVATTGKRQLPTTSSLPTDFREGNSSLAIVSSPNCPFPRGEGVR